jgi:hypothetical protein
MKILEATHFIKEALKSFITDFPNTRVRYEFDVDARVHCVEVVPNSVYKLDGDYINWENDFTNKFLQVFPCQNICFFSDDAFIGINKIEYELKGGKFVDLISTNDFESHIYFEQIHISNSSNYSNIESISATFGVFNDGIPNQVKKSNIVIDKANSLTSMENQSQVLFSINYPMAA